MGQGVGRRRAGARAGGEQFGRGVGGVSQTAQLVAVQGEHRAERVAVDVSCQLDVALEPIGVALAKQHEGLGRSPRAIAPCREVGISGARLLFQSFGNREEQTSRPIGADRFVGVAIAAGIFPTEQHAAHERGQGSLARLIAAEDDIQMRSEGAHRMIGESPKTLDAQILKVGVAALLGHQSPSPCTSRSNTKSVASSAKQRTCFSESDESMGRLRARNSS